MPEVSTVKRPRPDLGGRYDQFKRACRVELKRLGIPHMRFKISQLTHNPIAILDTDAAGDSDLGKAMDRFYQLADQYGIVASAVPAASIRMSRAGMD